MSADDVKAILKLVTRYSGHVSAADCAADAGYARTQYAEAERAQKIWDELELKLNSLVQQ